jgi:hypothetical protein
VPMAPPQAASVFFAIEEHAPPNSAHPDSPSNRSRFSLASIQSSTSATNTKPPQLNQLHHKICKKGNKPAPRTSRRRAVRPSEKQKSSHSPPPAKRARVAKAIPPATVPAALQATNVARDNLLAPKPPRKPKAPAQRTRCTCRKTKCLKLYCECFAAGGVCGPKCRCDDCHNKESLNELRQLIIQETVGKNPLAFKSKFKKIEEKNIKKLHSRGCNCRKTGCVKNYCECYHAGIGCSPLCKCSDCRNDKIAVAIDDVTAYRDKVLRKRKRRNYLYDFYFARCKTSQ